MVRRLSPQSPGWRALMTFGLVHCFVVILCVCLLVMLLFIWVPLLCIVSLRWYGLCVLFLGCCWLSCQYLPNDWLQRLFWGSLTMSRGCLHKALAEDCLWFSWFRVLFHCLIVWCVCIVRRLYVIYFILLRHDVACLYCLPTLRDIFHTPTAWCSLFVLSAHSTWYISYSYGMM